MKILYAVNNSLRGGEKGSGRDRYCILCSLSGAWTHYKSTSLAAFCVSALAYLLCISSESERLHCVCLHAAALTGSDLKMLCSLVARQPPPPRRRLSARVYSHHIYIHIIWLLRAGCTIRSLFILIASFTFDACVTNNISSSSLCKLLYAWVQWLRAI